MGSKFNILSYNNIKDFYPIFIGKLGQMCVIKYLQNNNIEYKSDEQINYQFMFYTGRKSRYDIIIDNKLINIKTGNESLSKFIILNQYTDIIYMSIGVHTNITRQYIIQLIQKFKQEYNINEW